jgi:hypothetical protein
MKKLIILLFISTIGYSQSEYSYYIAGSLSVTNNNTSFTKTSFPSLEFGLMYENISVGLVGGTNSLEGDGYWSELKTSVFIPIKKVNFYTLLGYGIFFDGGNFIEYGAGMCYFPKSKINGTLQLSNWAGTWYLTPGFVINL